MRPDKAADAQQAACLCLSFPGPLRLCSEESPVPAAPEGRISRSDPGNHASFLPCQALTYKEQTVGLLACA